MAEAVDAVVTAAQGGDAERFGEALIELRQVDGEQLSVVLGALTRDLVERTHPDGLDADDAEALLDGTITASAWYRDFDGDALLHALADTLGVGLAEEATPRDGFVVITHGLLLITYLLGVGRVRLAPVLDAALRELMREQTMELP